MVLNIWLHAGANFTSGTHAVNTWHTTNANRLSDSQSSFFSSTDNTFFITGVQMEVGSQATPFEHRSFGEELELCKRYFQPHFPVTCHGVTNGSTGIARMTIALQPTMRAAPSATAVGTIDVYSGTHGAPFESLGNSWTTQNQFQFDANTTATIQGAAGQGAVVYSDNSANTTDAQMMV